MTTRILLVEDDERLGAQVAEQLRSAGFETVWFKDGSEAARHLEEDFQLVILDLMLPGTHGMDLLKRLRTSSDVPVLILSARNESFDKVRALKLGADDYMTKPFWPDELLERVKARMRRPALRRGDAVDIGPLRIDYESREVWMNGAPVDLTRVELDLLVFLAKRPGAAVTRQTLVDKVLDPEREGTARTLDVHISRLRKKLGGGKIIATVWGIGYRLDVQGEP